MSRAGSAAGGAHRAAARVRASAAIAGVVLLSGCAASAGAAPVDQAATDRGPAAELRLGYLGNLTHAPAVIGVSEGLIADALGETELSTEVFSAGPAEIEALSAGAIDAAYIGPGPAINSWLRSGGRSAVVIAGATTGGASLVVRDGIRSPADLAGTTIATPQLGNTQDIAARAWLADRGLEAPATGGGDVTVQPTDNADTLTLFARGDVDGAWLPEPWASRLVLDEGAHVLVDEASLWPDGAFPTTVLVVDQTFAAEHPQTVTALLTGHVAATDRLADEVNDAGVADDAGDLGATDTADELGSALEELTGSPLPDETRDRALGSMRFGVDPIESAFPIIELNASAAGIGVPSTGAGQGLEGLIDLGALDAVLADAGREPIEESSG